jgi:hypothetical protein
MTCFAYLSFLPAADCSGAWAMEQENGVDVNPRSPLSFRHTEPFVFVILNVGEESAELEYSK